MSENGEPVGRLHLVGYEKLTDHGLALPVFGRSRDANLFFTARCSTPGEAGGRIAGFDVYDPDRLERLSLEQTREAGVGEPWINVFLWEGVVYIGTAKEIWPSLAKVRASIADHAPLSLLALAEEAEHVEARRLAGEAFSWLTKRYGREKALEWCTNIYLRGIVRRAVRRQSGGSAYHAQTRRGLQEDLDLQRDGEKITVFLRRILPRSDIDAFIGGASSFGLRYDISYIPAMDFMMQVPEGSLSRRRVAGKRTSEKEMRIAALQVAASKPHGKATRTELKNEVDRYVALTSEDRLPSKTRRNEAMYQQIVGNVVSHRGSRNNIFAKGWAIYTGDGIQITDAGREHLSTLGLKG